MISAYAASICIPIWRFTLTLRPVSTQENSPRIGPDRNKFNLLMCLQCQFSVSLRWSVHRYKIASNWAKNWHRRRMFRLNFVPIRSDPRIGWKPAFRLRSWRFIRSSFTCLDTSKEDIVLNRSRQTLYKTAIVNPA